MTTQMIINILFATLGGLGGWILNSVKESVKDLQTSDKALSDKVQNIEVLVVGQYVKHDDLERMSNAIFTKLDKIYDKLDTKVDKSK